MAGLAIAGGVGLQLYSSHEAGKNLEKGTKLSVEQEKMGREQQERILQGQIERQKPFLEAGELALPDLVEAIQNRGDVSDLPATRIQRDLISDVLGENVPDFIKENALLDLEAIEAEKNKSRLSNLANVGLGATGRTAQTGGRIASGVGGSLLREGDTLGRGLQQQAQNRQNLISSTIGGLSHLPSLYAAQSGGGLPAFNVPQGFGTYDSGTGLRTAFEL